MTDSPDKSEAGLEPRLSRRAILGLSAAACGAALLYASSPARAASYEDRTALRFLEDIELFEAEFFRRVALSATVEGLSEREMNTFARVAQQDNEHALWFRIARRREGVGAFERHYSPTQSSSRPPQTYVFPPDAFSTRNGLYSVAIAIKETAVAAYHGQVGDTDDPKLVQAFAALAGVEGRHLAMLKELFGQDPLVGFENAITRRMATNKLTRYGFASETLL